MLYLLDVVDFISSNHSDVKKITQSLCVKYGVHCGEDILQEFYTDLISENLLTKYDPNHPSATKFSTYIFSKIKNIVRGYKRTNEGRIELHKYTPVYLDNKDVYTDDENFIQDRIARDYESTIYNNKISDSLSFDFNLFEKYLKERNKFYTLKKRRNKSIDTNGLSLYTVFKLIREGYSNKEIAKSYGVSVMFITVLKSEIKSHIIKFGLYWKETSYSSNKKSYYSEKELREYADTVLQA